MPMSVNARLAWGIDFGDPVNAPEEYHFLSLDEDGEPGIDLQDFEDEVMPALFGFTEERPAYPLPDNATPDERWAWRREVKEPWEERRSAAVPLAFQQYGYESGGDILLLKRSLTEIGLGARVVDMASLAPPSPDEVAAFDTALDRMGYDGDRTLRLLLTAQHG